MSKSGHYKKKGKKPETMEYQMKYNHENINENYEGPQFIQI